MAEGSSGSKRRWRRASDQEDSTDAAPASRPSVVDQPKASAGVALEAPPEAPPEARPPRARAADERLGGTGLGRGRGRNAPHPAASVAAVAAPAFNAGVQIEYARRYAEDLARVQAMLPPSARWLDAHCHLESILMRTWRGGGKPQVLLNEVSVDLAGLVASWPPGLDGCVCNCVFKQLSKPDARVSEWGWIEENLHMFAPGSPVSGKLWFTIGLHPHDAGNWDQEAEDRVRRLCAHPKCVAIGECGLDFFKHSHDEAAKQERAFRAQARLAVELGKPLVVHARQAEELCMQVLRDLLPPDHPIHIHCYSDSLEHARELCERWENLRIGFTGAITFPAKGPGPAGKGKAKGKGKGKAGQQPRQEASGPAHFEELLRALPLERLLLETDGPYMCPNPFRGQTAHPGHVHRVAERIAEVKAVPLAEVMAATRASCRTVYGI